MSSNEIREWTIGIDTPKQKTMRDTLADARNEAKRLHTTLHRHDKRSRYVTLVADYTVTRNALTSVVWITTAEALRDALVQHGEDVEIRPDEDATCCYSLYVERKNDAQWTYLMAFCDGFKAANGQ